mmetsp:Transcript_81266/g.243653  ORF Transcript_81266/g.243653 Transcript_81266/m.243653 type:complete len:285 (-) Transcript_81266:533-1387(-)
MRAIRAAAARLECEERDVAGVGAPSHRAELSAELLAWTCALHARVHRARLGRLAHLHEADPSRARLDECHQFGRARIARARAPSPRCHRACAVEQVGPWRRRRRRQRVAGPRTHHGACRPAGIDCPARRCRARGYPSSQCTGRPSLRARQAPHRRLCTPSDLAAAGCATRFSWAVGRSKDCGLCAEPEGRGRRQYPVRSAKAVGPPTGGLPAPTRAVISARRQLDGRATCITLWRASVQLRRRRAAGERWPRCDVQQLLCQAPPRDVHVHEARHRVCRVRTLLA